MNWITLFLLIPAALLILTVLAIISDLRVFAGDAKELRQVVKNRFYVYLESKGFKVETKNMLTTFRKVARDRIQIVQLNWDKYGKPCFSISFGETPNIIIETSTGTVPPSSVEPCHSESLGFLYRKKGAGLFGMGAWFQLRKPLLNWLSTGKREYTPDEVVDQLIEYFPEVENWFETRQVGVHVSMLRSEAQRVRLDCDREASHNLNRLLDKPGFEALLSLWKYLSG